MYPVLFKLGTIPIHAYGFFATLGFVVGLYLALIESDRFKADRNHILDLALFCLIAGVTGARTTFILLNLKKFVANPSEIFNIYSGGLELIGGCILVFAVSFFYLRKKKLPVWRYMDIVAPAIVAGFILSRIGCFLAGCGFGKATNVSWAVVYHHPQALAPCCLPLHPTQLYEAISHLFLFVLLWAGRRHKVFEGQIFWLFVLSHGILRLVLYQYRGGSIPVEILGGMTGPQFVGGVIAFVAAIMLKNLNDRQAKD
jgi:phosphatidylglycerol---prolipoprotein diacylglyceryl transferase